MLAAGDTATVVAAVIGGAAAITAALVGAGYLRRRPDPETVEFAQKLSGAVGAVEYAAGEGSGNAGALSDARYLHGEVRGLAGGVRPFISAKAEAALDGALEAMSASLKATSQADSDAVATHAATARAHEQEFNRAIRRRR